jgi:hypothetical protein
MRSIERLKKMANIRVGGQKLIPNTTFMVYEGELDFGRHGFRGTVLWGYDEMGWEHVSFSHYDHESEPTWKDLCRIKELFWGNNVTVLQFLPAEKAYIHGVPGWKDSNVFHLWRPVDGDFSNITEEMLEYL